MKLVETLIKNRWLKTPRIIEAFKKINRADFLPGEIRYLAEINEALSIGRGQTISQPLVVAFMLELLQPEPEDKILDIGSGSGWTTGLLAQIISQKENKNIKIKKSKGRVIALEIIPEIKEFGEKNVAKYGFIEKGMATFILTDGSNGYKKEAPFDKILCSASLPQNKQSLAKKSEELLPRAWREQLKIEGVIVTPISSSIWIFIKKSEEKFEAREYPGFTFVPFVLNQ